MMVPQMLGQLLDTITQTERNIQRLYDPFLGSGTVLGEAMGRGLNFTGQDINPLAILVSRAKVGPYDHGYLSGSTERIKNLIAEDSCDDVEVGMTYLNKWFFPHVAIALSKIRRAIQSEDALWVRRFLWVALAETARRCSNSRTSTYKLHIRDDNDLALRYKNIDTIDIFQRVLDENSKAFQEQRQLLLEGNHLNADYSYKGQIQVTHTDSSLAYKGPINDFLVTSPPYGDNKTTVPYGQAAFLPLQWVDLSDIDEGLDSSWLNSTGAIDNKSLGGSMQDINRRSERLREISPAFADVIGELEQLDNGSFASKVVSFCADFYQCIQPTIKALRPSSPMVWVVGNRCVGGKIIPLDKILADYLRCHNAHEIVTLHREIFNKRMPTKNNNSEMMNRETIMVWRTSA